MRQQSASNGNETIVGMLLAVSVLSVDYTAVLLSSQIAHDGSSRFMRRLVCLYTSTDLQTG